MKVTKPFLNQLFEETITQFNERIYPLDNDVKLAFIKKEDFLASAKEDPLIQQQIRLGIYKNIEKEYPNFVVVYEKDKMPMMKLFGLPYKVSVCDELAKDILKPYSAKEVKAYLTYVFAHELTHIAEYDLMKERPEFWQQCLNETNQNEGMAKELFVDTIAEEIGDKEMYQRVMDSIWGLVKQRVKKIQSQRLF